jgi:hypothetical protein
VDTSKETIEVSAEKILAYLRKRGLVPEAAAAKR